ncbi:uncharacterized protein [Ptychodera flava]|uniref:uncharacterized protein n=1 Tax=Ptychodera flava TaxID=63121 RepID=UPI00396A9A2A
MANLHPRRVMIWAYPRSLSTAFELSLASRQETKVFHGLYSMAYHFGDDALYPNDEMTVPGYTFKDVIETLESGFPENDVILCKDMAFCLDGKYDRLPRGYIHTFLIRDPRRSIVSLCKTYRAKGAHLDTLPPTGGVKQLHDLHNYITDTLNQKSIIIDASDLVNHPEKIIRKYCEAVEIPYCDSYLNWKPDKIDHWHTIWKHAAIFESCFGNAVKSTHFKPLPDKGNPSVMTDFPPQAQLQIEAALPYHNELIQKRIQP